MVDKQITRKVLVLTGNTGTGKTTVANYLTAEYNIPQVITHTTRLPREGEVDGINYYFEDAASFEQNHYLETVDYAGNRYGSSWEGLERAWQKSPLISIVLDTAGAVTYAEALPTEAEIIFMRVDNVDELLARLRQRGDDVTALTQRIKSNEFQRDEQIPLALQGRAQVINNTSWAHTKKIVDQLVAHIQQELEKGSI